MSHDPDALHLFADELNSSAVKAMLRWRGHGELDRLLSKLISHTSRKAFLDSYAEAMVAMHLLSRRCQLKFEVPTPNGRRCDFEVSKGGSTFFLHVKRIDTNRPAERKALPRTITNRLRKLERIARPYVVQMHWREGITAEEMSHLVNQAERFILHAHIGDEMIARDSQGHRLGGVQIIAPWEGEHVSVTVGLREAFADETQHFRKLMQRAYQQFMPRAENVILLCSSNLEDVADFESALLGSHVERWDAFPPRGKRLAHGRAGDGFWHNRRYLQSQTAAWFHFAPEQRKLRSRLWVRHGADIDADLLARVQELFESEK